MFSVVIADTIAYLDSLRAPGLALEGIKSIQLGDYSVPATDHPAITVDWDDDCETSFNGNHLQIEAGLAITLYAVSLESEATAEQIVQDLLLRWEPTSQKWMGLIPALHVRRGWTNNTLGLGFVQKIEPRIRRGTASSKSKGFSTAGASIRLKIITKSSLSNL